jgi:putative ABC transport system permease protein
MRPIRTILTTLGVALGIALYVGIDIINRSTLGYFRESVDSVAGKAKLSVTAGETGFPEAKLEIVEKTPGVKAAVPVITTQAYVANTDESLFVLGVDLLKEQSVRTYKTADEQGIADPLIFLNQPDSIILTHSFAEAHHLKMDDAFELATAHGTKKFVVRGMLTAEGPAKAYGGAIAIMDLDGARYTFGKEGKLDRIDIIPDPKLTTDQVKANLEKNLGSGFTVQRPESQAESTEHIVKSFQATLTFFSTLALLVGLFLVTNSVSISVAERRREIGTLRALGATRKGILGLFLADAAVIGLLGASAGIGLGRLLASQLLKLVTQSMSAQFKMRVDVTHLDFSSAQMIQALLLGMIASILAALWPAYKASTIQPLEALKQNDASSLQKSSSLYRATPYLGAGMLIYLTIASYFEFGARHVALEYFNQFCAILGSAFAGPPIVILLIRIFRPIAIPFLGVTASMAERNLLRNPGRTGSNVMSLMVGLILVVLISTVNVSFKNTVVNWFDKIRRGDLLITSTGNAVALDVQPLHEDIGREIALIPGVDGGPAHSAYAIRYISSFYEDKQIGIKAYDEPDPKVGYTGFDVQDRSADDAGNALFHSAVPTVLVSANFKLHFHLQTGDSIELKTPDGMIKFLIAGVVVDFSAPNGVVYISRDNYKKYWHDPLVTFFGVRVLPGFTPPQVRKTIDQKLSKLRNLQVISNGEFKAQMNDVIDQSFAYTRAIEAAALLVGLLGLLNTLLISVMERTRELGMLRALGMSKHQLSRMILQEAVIQGGFGSLAAVALGIWVGYLWITHSLASLLGWMVTFYFPWKPILFTVVIGTFTALVAGIYPARRAVRLEITDALDYE